MSGDEWQPLASIYCPIKVGSIDSTDCKPHDKALTRAINSKYRPNERVVGVADRTLFVARLDPNTDESTLQKFFSKYGPIVGIRLVRDIVTGFSKRYAFIEYKRRKYTTRAYDEANGEVIDGRKILVDYEHERTMTGWRPRRLGGGFGGRKESGQLRFGCRDRPWKRPLRPLRGETGVDVGDDRKDRKRKEHKRERVEISRKERYRYDRHPYRDKRTS